MAIKNLIPPLRFANRNKGWRVKSVGGGTGDLWDTAWKLEL